jgi:hypothetical protein
MTEFGFDKGIKKGEQGYDFIIIEGLLTCCMVKARVLSIIIFFWGTHNIWK